MKKYIIGAMSLAMLGGVFSLTNTKTEVKAKETKSVTVTKIVSAKDNKATESYKLTKASLGQSLTSNKPELTETKIEAKAEVKQSYTNTIAFGQTVLPIGKLTMNSAHDVPSVFATQSYIDQGNIAQGYNPLDFNDGKMTYLCGHNPGVLAPIANYAGVGKQISVWDANGQKKDFVFKRVIEIPRGIYVGSSQSEAEAMAFLDNNMNDGEGIVLQYCSSDNYTKLIWILSPVN
jgi:hypothetical protein